MVIGTAREFWDNRIAYLQDAPYLHAIDYYGVFGDDPELGDGNTDRKACMPIEGDEWEWKLEPRMRLAQAASIMGISVQRASQLEASAFRKMREWDRENPDGDQ
jgi:hypothetical protein